MASKPKLSHTRRLKKKPGPQEAKPYSKPKDRDWRYVEPEHTATFWRNSYEHERLANQIMRMKLARAHADLDRIKKRA